MKIKKTFSAVDEDAILVDEEANRCYTCHQELSAGSPAPALVVDVQLHETSKLTIQVCLACYRRLDYDYTSAESHHQVYGCPILPESKIIVKTPNLSHKCFRCFEPLQDWSEHAVSLQDGILNASYPKVHKEVGYEFAVCLCNPCAHWKKFSGRMREVTTLKFPAFDLATRTLFLPPISTVHLEANSSKAGTKSINYPVSMLVNKAKSLLERFKDEASLSSPPSDITGSMLYIHTTKCKSSRSTHWSSDGFAFQKSSARVVRIQNSDHVIRETNWVTAGPGDSETKFKRRTITSSQLEDITLVHYLGEVDTGVQASREVDLEEEQPCISTQVSPQSCNKQIMAKKKDERKVDKPITLSNHSVTNIEDTPATPEADQVTVSTPILPSISSTDSAISEDPLLPTIVSVSGSVGGVTVMGSSPQLPLLEKPLLHSQVATQYSTSLVNKSIKKPNSPVQPNETLKMSMPDQKVLRPMLPTQPLPFNSAQQIPRPVQLAPQVPVNPGNPVTSTPNLVLLTQPPQVKSIQKITSPVQSYKTKVSIPDQEIPRPVLPTEPLPFNPAQQIPRPEHLAPQIPVNPGNDVTSTHNPVLLSTQPHQVNPAQSFQGLASKIVVSGNKIIVPHNFMASGARLLQVPSGDGTKRLVLINSSQVVTTSKNTVAKTTSVVTSKNTIGVVPPSTGISANN